MTTTPAKEPAQLPVLGTWQPLPGAEPPTPEAPAELANDQRINRLRARAAEKRTDRRDAVQTWTEKRQAYRDDRRAVREERRAQRDDKRADRAARNARLRDLATATGRRIIVTGPILAPMAVAWTGQSQFAVQILGWSFIASVLYAAAYELTTVYWAWLYHQARSDGDSGWEYRLATWAFAAGAALQQWWHYSDNWNATPRSVTYSAMSAVGVLLWEGQARLIHRRKLRTEGKLPPARPRIGSVRWLRYPVRSWIAWSQITLEGHQTLDAAWTAANRHLTARRTEHSIRKTDRAAVRSGLTLHRVVIPRVRTVDHGPAALPTYVTVDRADWPTPADRTGTPNRSLTGPDRRAALPPAHPQQPRNTPDPADRGPTVHDATTATRQYRANSATPHQNRSSITENRVERTGGPDRTDNELVLTDLEQQAVDFLQSTGRPISKRSIAEVVRTELGGSIASDRAVKIARHFRTLLPAA
ncbi:hypothetical protein [Streptomyces lydicus]|uniref:hypothetical protein n=1 Tax=Streptomyces lydicus TaxID=47763 RepID=UPI0037B32CAC